MVFFLLCIKADLENVAELKAEEHHRWCLDLKQSDGDEERKGVFVSDEEEHELSGSKGTAHFVFSWPDTRKQCSVSVVDVKRVTRNYSAADSASFVPLVAFDCRGCEPVAWYPGDDGFIVKAESGAVFEEVDLSDADGWTDYDDQANQGVSVMALEHKFTVHREK